MGRFGAILGPCGAAVGAVSCSASCGHRCHGNVMTSRAHFGGEPPIFLPFPPPPLASHPPALQSCKEPPVQGVPSCTPELLARGWRALSHEVSLHKQQQLAQGVPLGVIFRDFGGDLGRPGHHLGAISALFGGNSGSLRMICVGLGVILAAFLLILGSFWGYFRLTFG